MCAWYYIKSKKSGLFLEVSNGNGNDGTPLYPQEKKTGKLQKWYTDDDTSTIRTAINGSCLDIEDGQAVINVYTGKTEQQWVMEAGKIVNQRTKMVLSVWGRGTDATVIETDSEENVRQEWKFKPAT